MIIFGQFELFADAFSQLNFSGPVCLGDTLTFECTVIGGASTVWKGSIFECSTTNNEIPFLHNRFNSTTIATTKSCNDGAIVALGLDIEDNRYTSHLNVTINSNMTGKKVKCAHDDGTSSDVVGYYTINKNDFSCTNFSEGFTESTLVLKGTNNN